MNDAKGDADNHHCLLDFNKVLRSFSYLKLHSELTLSAFKRIKELECAKDIASECLINCWQNAERNTSVIFQKNLDDELNRLCSCFLQKKRRLPFIENEYFFEWSTPVSVWQGFRLGNRMEISRCLSVLEPLEKKVINLIIFEELDLPQIADRLCKPLTTVKILRDRAVYQLRKSLNPKSLPINQLYGVISLFSGIAVATLEKCF